MKNSFLLRNQINSKCFPHYQITPPLSASQSTFSYFTRNNSNFNSTNNCFNSKYNSSRESMQFQPNKSYISTTSSICRNKSALNKSQNSLKSNVDNQVEMINMRLRCDILLAKIENLKVRIPKHNKVLKNKIIKIKEKNNNEEDVNLSNLADKLVDVFGLENNSNDKLIENIETNEELKIGELITDIITDSGDVNSRNKYNDDMLYILSESIDTEKKENDNYNKNNEIDRIKVNILNALNETETEDTNNNNKNNNNTITFKEQGIQTNNDEYINESQPSSNKKNNNSQFQPTVIETLPDFSQNDSNNNKIILTESNSATKKESSNQILNTEEEEDLIFSTIMENAKRMEEEHKKEKNNKISENTNTTNNHKQQPHENEPPKKIVTFNEDDYRLIKFNQQDIITKFTVYDPNANRIKSKPINYKEYISFLRELSKTKKKMKPCIIGKFTYNKKQPTSKSQTKQMKSKSFKTLPTIKHKQPTVKKQPLHNNNNNSKHPIKKPQKRSTENNRKTATNSQPPPKTIETPIAKVVGNIIMDIIPDENENNNTIQVKPNRKYSL